MDLIIFWFIMALMYFALAIISAVALYKLKKAPSILEEFSHSGIIYGENGKIVKAVPVETTLYKFLKVSLITEIIAFVLACSGAIVSFIITSG